MLRCLFAVKDSYARVLEIERRLLPEDPNVETPQSSSRRTSRIFLAVGDVIVLISVGLMAFVLANARPTAGISGVPMGIGISLGVLFYLVGIPVRILNK
jgi:hypothetical protein